MLTAAHCKGSVDNGDLSKLTLVMGASKPTERKKFKLWRAKEHKVKNFITHSEYDGFSAYNDVAIIETMERIEFSDTIWPLCLPTESSENADEYAEKYLRVI